MSCAHRLTAVGGYAEYIQRAELSEEEKYEAAQYIVEEANRLAVMSERLLQMAALRGEQAARESVDVPALLEKGGAHRRTQSRCPGRGAGAGAGGRLYGAGRSGAAGKPDGEPGGQCCKGMRTGRQCAPLRTAGDGPPDAHGAGYGPRHGRGDAGAHRRTVLQAGQGRSREQGGAGLGLALCFQIAQSHGAALSFTSAPGAGTTAAVIFTA